MSSSAPGPEQHPGELRRHELASAAAGAVHDEHTVRHPAARVALRLAQRQVVEAQLAEGVARSEAKAPNHVVPVHRRSRSDRDQEPGARGAGQGARAGRRRRVSGTDRRTGLLRSECGRPSGTGDSRPGVSQWRGPATGRFRATCTDERQPPRLGELCSRGWHQGVAGNLPDTAGPRGARHHHLEPLGPLGPRGHLRRPRHAGRGLGARDSLLPDHRRDPALVDQKRITRAIRTELQTLQDALAVVVLQIARHRGEMGYSLLEAILSTLRTSGQVAGSGRALKLIDDLLLTDTGTPATTPPAEAPPGRSLLSLRVPGYRSWSRTFTAWTSTRTKSSGRCSEIRAGTQAFEQLGDGRCATTSSPSRDGVDPGYHAALMANVEECYQRAAGKASESWSPRSPPCFRPPRCARADRPAPGGPPSPGASHGDRVPACPHPTRRIAGPVAASKPRSVDCRGASSAARFDARTQFFDRGLPCPSVPSGASSPAQPTIEGAGVKLRRAFGFGDTDGDRPVPAAGRLPQRSPRRLPGRAFRGIRTAGSRPSPTCWRAPWRTGTAWATRGIARRRRHPVDDRRSRHPPPGDAAGRQPGTHARVPAAGRTCPRRSR